MTFQIEQRGPEHFTVEFHDTLMADIVVNFTTKSRYAVKQLAKQLTKMDASKVVRSDVEALVTSLGMTLYCIEED